MRSPVGAEQTGVCDRGCAGVLTRMTRSSLSLAERWESAKAGLLALATAVIPAVALIGLEIQRPSALPTWTTLAVHSGAIAVSVFLFGVTYRYAIRSDTNPHLRNGLVGAFGLVRGLGLLENGATTSLDLPWLTSQLGGSLLLFSLCATSLDFAIARGWLRPIPSSPQ
ncbi:hypothetical protein [Synechococcus elongatus]|uniref:hypothetical protein n=1 Tax=Synechococcus elongatus TaxID=32046 RepID=UPI00192DAC53|nr:hypothetical protein [Synechococcus elongatus]